MKIPISTANVKKLDRSKRVIIMRNGTRIPIGIYSLLQESRKVSIYYENHRIIL